MNRKEARRRRRQKFIFLLFSSGFYKILRYFDRECRLKFRYRGISDFRNRGISTAVPVSSFSATAVRTAKYRGKPAVRRYYVADQWVHQDCSRSPVGPSVGPNQLDVFARSKRVHCITSRVKIYFTFSKGKHRLEISGSTKNAVGPQSVPSNSLFSRIF